MKVFFCCFCFYIFLISHPNNLILPNNLCINLLYNCLNYLFQETPKVKKKQYDPVALQNAYKALQEEGMSVYRAARNYGVPESTLRLVSVTGKSLNFLFDEDTEKKLVDHIKYMASIGYGYSRCDVLYLATDLAISLGKKETNRSNLVQQVLLQISRTVA